MPIGTQVYGGGALKPIYSCDYADITTLALPLPGAPFAPDGTNLADGEEVLFTGFTILSGPDGRGVYKAIVDSGGDITGWIRIVFGQSSIGDSIDGDRVVIRHGVTYADKIFQCIDTPGAIWIFYSPDDLMIRDEGVVIDPDVEEIDLVGEDIEVTSIAPKKVQITVDSRRIISFVIADWVLDGPSNMYYFDLVHSLSSISADVVIWSASNEEVSIAYENLDADTARIWIAPDARFIGYAKISR